MRRVLAAFVFTAMGGGAVAEPSHGDVLALASEDLPVIVGLSTPSAREIEVFLPPSQPEGDPLIDLGSVTKFVTAMTVLHLVEEGQLDLQARLGDLLPDVPAEKAGITVHQLLTHTGGFVESVADDAEDLGREAFLTRAFEAPLLDGSGYAYSNVGYSVLAAIVETASGQSFETYLIERVLAPRGLGPIGYGAVYDEARSLRSERSARTLYRQRPIEAASWGRPSPGWALIGNGGAVTTAETFLEVWSAFLEGRIVGPDLVALALTPHADEGGGESFYGYGLVVEESEDLGLMYWHDGGNEIFSAEWRHFVRDSTTFLVAGPGESAFEAAGLLMERGR